MTGSTEFFVHRSCDGRYGDRESRYRLFGIKDGKLKGKRDWWQARDGVSISVLNPLSLLDDGQMARDGEIEAMNIPRNYTYSNERRPPAFYFRDDYLGA